MPSALVLGGTGAIGRALTPRLAALGWDATSPAVLDMTAALALGYTPVGDYATTVAAELDWLLTAPSGLDHAFLDRFLDYTAEDAWLAD